MRLKIRKIPSTVLLVWCTSVSVLGQGLHLLVPGHTHHCYHHHAQCVVSHSFHHQAHKHRHAGDEPVAYAGSLARGSSSLATAFVRGEAAETHVCGICAFLYQRLGVPVEIAEHLTWQPLSVSLHAVAKEMDSTTSLGPQAPRGPPLLT